MSDGVGRLAELIARASGIRVRPAQAPSLTAAARRATGTGDARDALRQALERDAGPEVLQRLLDELTVKETSFLRHRAQLEAIDWRALREQARRDGARQVRVWSAGCASGEEAYSLALLACEALGPHPPPVSVLGTDISSSALAAAEAGLYRPRSLRELDRPLLERYFERRPDGVAVGEQLRRLVDFRRHSLSRDDGPPAGHGRFDLILCRNVLIYLEPRAAQQAVESLRRALTPAGALLLGAADQLCVSPPARAALADRPARRGRHEAKREGRGSSPRPGAPASRGRGARPRHESAGAGSRAGERPQARLDDALEEAARLADEGHVHGAIEAAARILGEDPMNAAARFVRGAAELAAGDAPAASTSLRAALYADPTFALAAFVLGRAHEALGERAAARRAYEQALRTFDPDDARYAWMLGHLEISELAVVCRTRLRALS